ncbi:UNVERIFIED_CONTAM: hypothetical protein K2H54_008141, partial [Gekko kuhli]
MGGLLSGVSFKEPATVEDCDSTWETDSEPEPEPLPEPRGGGPAEEELPAAGARPEDPEQREEAEGQEDLGGEGGGGGGEEGGREEGEAAGAGQGDDAIEVTAKPKRSFYAARDLYKYRHQYPNFKDLRYQNDLCNLRFYKNKIPFKPD